MELAPGKGRRRGSRAWGREAHGPLEAHGYPAAGALKPGITPPQPTVPRGAPQSPARAFPTPGLRTRNAVSAETLSPPAAAPDSCGPDGGAPPRAGVGRGEGGREEGVADEEEGRVGEPGQAHTTAPGIPRSALRGTKAAERRLRLPQPRKRGRFRLMAKRPSDRRSPGRNPGPQGAFEVSMINVSCNSH